MTRIVSKENKKRRLGLNYKSFGQMYVLRVTIITNEMNEDLEERTSYL